MAEINGSFYLSISNSLTEKNTAISELYQWDVKTCLWYLWMSSVVGTGEFNIRFYSGDIFIIEPCKLSYNYTETQPGRLPNINLYRLRPQLLFFTLNDIF